MKKILIIQTAFIGDVILATPLIEKLKRYFPETPIDFLLRKGNEGLLREHPKLNEVLIWDKKKSKYNALAKLARLVRTNNYDLLVNLQRFASSGLITTSSGAAMKVGFSKNPFSFAFTHKFPHLVGQGIHEVHRNLSLIAHITDNEFQKPVLYPTRDDYNKIKPYKLGPYITISPASVWFTKQWPIEKWVELIDKIKQDWKVYLLGGPDDLELCHRLKEKSTHDVMVLAGELNFLQSAALMETARMNYMNDSAPMHMASAVNAPITAVYCSTIPEFGFGPLSDESHTIQNQELLPCRPCGLHGKKSCPKGHFKCALSIDVSQMLPQ